MKRKKCGRCGAIMPLTEFYLRADSKDGRRSYCKPCERKWKRENPKTKERDRIYRETYLRDIKQKIDNIKIGKGCSVCGYRKCPRSLCFHHINPEDKSIDISYLGATLAERLKEMEKCVVLCLNCHSEFHSKA